MGGEWLPDDLSAPRPERQCPATPRPAEQPVPDPWAIVSTLLAGPLVWGTLGWLADRAWGTGPALTVTGILVGAVSAFYIVYVRFGRG